MLFLALRKVQIFKMASPQVPQPDKNSPAAKFPIPSTVGGIFPHPLWLFGKPCVHRSLNNERSRSSRPWNNRVVLNQKFLD